MDIEFWEKVENKIKNFTLTEDFKRMRERNSDLEILQIDNEKAICKKDNDYYIICFFGVMLAEIKEDIIIDEEGGVWNIKKGRKYVKKRR